MADTKPAPAKPDLDPIIGETADIRERFPTGCGPGETEADRDKRLKRR